MRSLIVLALLEQYAKHVVRALSFNEGLEQQGFSNKLLLLLVNYSFGGFYPGAIPFLLPILPKMNSPETNVLDFV